MAQVDDDIQQVRKILVVDDDMVMNRLLRGWLQSQGFETESASNGTQALAHIYAMQPDLVFLDIMMPDISGLEVLEQVRTHTSSEQDEELAVIMMTASDESEDVITALRHRADDYVRKPFTASEFHAVLDRTIKRVHLSRQNAALRRQLDEKRRQLEAELARAAQVQAELLPRHSPNMSAFELAACCIPAREVGGDFYDWQQLVSDRLLTLTLGDVTGKGMSAALLMTTTRAVLRAVSVQNPPARAVSLAARTLEADLEHTERFVTLFHAQLDTQTRRLVYVDAGHGHVFARRADGTIEELPSHSLPLGIFAGEAYDEGSYVFSPGDVLVVYSDGLVDARPELSPDHTIIAAPLADKTSAQDMLTALVELADPTRTLPDDLTILVLRCRTE